MIPIAFQTKYPEVSHGLTEMFSGLAGAHSPPAVLDTIKVELRTILTTDEPLKEVALSIWSDAGGSPARFFEHGVAAYHHLGVSDDVRDFIGSVWSSALAQCPEETLQDFLRLIFRQERLFLFEALDFAPKIFKHIPVRSSFMVIWVAEVRKAVGTDLYQRGLWGCLESYSRFQPVAALELISAFLAERQDSQTRSALARMLFWIRTGENSRGALNAPLEDIEKNLRGGGDPTQRALYIESWAFAAGSPALDEAKALELRAGILRDGEDEILSWTFLLAQVVGANREGWRWAHRELMQMTLCPLAPQARHWVLVAALNGWSVADENDKITHEAWMELFVTLQPLAKTDGAIWQQLEHVVVEMLGKKPGRATTFLVKLAALSGKIWCELLDEERDHLAWLNQTLQQTGHAVPFVTALCLSSERRACRLGVKLFGECAVAALQPEAVAVATAVQIELIILQASLRLGEYEDTARIHASIARRVDEIGGPLAEMFYDEVSTQSRNTHQYRVAIEKHSPVHAKLLDCLKEAHQHLDATILASKSPALKMQIPGRYRAEKLAMRRFSRQIAKGMSKFSLLERIATTVPLLYGRTWHMQDAGGNLTAASALTKSEVSMEIPRLEYATPDAMKQRRLLAGRRITALQHGVDESEP